MNTLTALSLSADALFTAYLHLTGLESITTWESSIHQQWGVAGLAVCYMLASACAPYYFSVRGGRGGNRLLMQRRVWRKAKSWITKRKSLTWWRTRELRNVQEHKIRRGWKTVFVCRFCRACHPRCTTSGIVGRSVVRDPHLLFRICFQLVSQNSSCFLSSLRQLKAITPDLTSRLKGGLNGPDRHSLSAHWWFCGCSPHPASEVLIRADGSNPATVRLA